ncbi:MAG: hypothetical protein AUJ97_00425 [Bacteroidetes bacterium CG2_30_32_10]|nr:MAG: hypothetical protein AUJ97_00425 [Bacteroidetes bacterium CG2_30_32_10]
MPLLEKQNKSVIEDVNVEKFSTLIAEKKVQLLDVRTPEEWQEGIINEAIKMNYYDDNFSEQLKTLNKNEPIYVYCKSGNRSRKAATQMEEMGFTKIYNLVGGFSAWRGAAKNVSK